MDLDQRRRRARLLQRYVLNPSVRLVVWLGLLRGYVLIETTGRRTGRRRQTAVGAQRDGDVLWVVAEQGPYAGWVRNLEADPRVRVLTERRWRPGTARLEEGDDPQQRLDRFERPGHARTVRRFGSALRTVRIKLDRA